MVSVKRIILGLLCILIDIAALTLAAISLAVFLSGGFVASVAGHDISLLRARNPLLMLYGLAVVRYGLLRSIPFLLIPRLDPGKLPIIAAGWCNSLLKWLEGDAAGRLQKFIVIALLGSFVLKSANALYYCGFSYGDDVEIQVMTFSALQNQDLGVWDIRSPFYPIVFIYPLQWLVWKLGFHDPGVLIFAGRLVVILFSLLNLWLLFKIGTRYSGKMAVGLLAFLFLAVSRLHNRLGSSELPRTVSTAFLLLSFWLVLLRKRGWWYVVAGFCFGIGAALRIGEAVFAAPLAATLLYERRFRDLFLMLFSAGVVWLLIFGPGDLLFWPRMFYSIRNMVEFSVIKRLSSTGYQPFWQYLRLAPAVSDVFTIGLFLYSLKLRACRKAQVWTLLPVLLLSFVQTKQDRYLLPILPFFLLCAAFAFYDLLQSAVVRKAGHLQVLVIFILIGACTLEIEGFRLRGSREAVKVCSRLAEEPDVRDVIVQDANIVGARLYFPADVNVERIESQRLSDADYLTRVIARSNAQYLVIKRQDLEDLGYQGLLEQYHYKEVSLPGMTSDEYSISLRNVPRR